MHGSTNLETIGRGEELTLGVYLPLREEVA
jgi:hypothetical protein